MGELLSKIDGSTQQHIEAPTESQITKLLLSTSSELHQQPNENFIQARSNEDCPVYRTFR